jgi:diguanylate cyclase (GGDEF)-like protein
MIAEGRRLLVQLLTPEGRFLLTASGHPPTVSRERAVLVNRRVRQISAAFSVLTVLWIAVDAVTIPWPLWGELAAGRAIASLAFVGCAIRRPKDWPASSALGALIPLFAIPIVFFLFSSALVNDIGAQSSIAANTAYHYLPFIVAAGLSLFPLTALESVILGGGIVSTMLIANAVWPMASDSQSTAMTTWRLVVIAGIGGLAALSQLHFFVLLIQQATRDGLTGLLARRVGEELLETQFAYAQRNNLPFSLLFVDIDNFKQVNDRFGHPAGDGVLRNVADSLKRAFRRQDSIIRWGGEEFVIALPATDFDHALAAVQHLAEVGIGRRPEGGPVTASIGVAERIGDSITCARDLAALADQRMYMAKRAGRNRYQTINGPRPWLPPDGAPAETPAMPRRDSASLH